MPISIEERIRMERQLKVYNEERDRGILHSQSWHNKMLAHRQALAPREPESLSEDSSTTQFPDPARKYQ